MRAIVLVIGFADFALEAGLDLGTNTNAIADFTGGHFIASLDHFTNDFMAHAYWQRAFAPTTVNGMDVGAADTACFDLDVNVAVFEGLWFELGRRSIDA